MPLTAYSISEQKEVDLEQVLNSLSRRYETRKPLDVNEIPEEWRAFLRTDIECPCCFVTGADVVRESISRTSKKAIRQGYFRFSSPGHKPECDYAGNDSVGFTPENLVAFGKANSNLPRAIRELVCKGIQAGVFSQKSIRDMRKWFFQKKASALFHVNLDPCLPKWLDNLHRITGPVQHMLPMEVPLSADIVAIPGFDWKTEATRVLAKRHIATLDTMREERLWHIHSLSTRVESLAKRYHGEDVFDPTVLQTEYTQSISLARFISHNYAPLASASKRRDNDVASCVLALSALLLFISGWNLAKSTELFARISTTPDQIDPMLGNVIGLNPFHDFEAWAMLKKLQESGLPAPDGLSPIDERNEIETDLRARFQVQSGK